MWKLRVLTHDQWAGHHACTIESTSTEYLEYTSIHLFLQEDNAAKHKKYIELVWLLVTFWVFWVL